MKIYTKTGDKGKTSLYGGLRVEKYSQRISAIGDVDELNALIGIVVNKVELINNKNVKDILIRVQNELFELGSDLASPYSLTSKLKIIRIDDLKINQLEKDIDMLQNDLEAIKNFILPGGSEIGALLHYARTVCRRAERSVVYLNSIEKINPDSLIYLNRLSDLIFVLARYANKTSGVSETPWIINK